MARRIDIDLGDRSYPIHIGPGLFAEAGALIGESLPAANCLVVSDETVAGLYGDRLTGTLSAAGFAPALAAFPAGEPHKTVDTLTGLWRACADARVDRAGCVVALGGGVPGDVGGFVAASWMRGVGLAQVPTTLLAMVDSSVGGKTGVNVPAGKNLVGAFKQPSCVVIDPEVLGTMEEREYRAGLAEVMKYGVIRDPDFFARQEATHGALVARDPAVVTDAVADCCAAKAWYVVNDEREGGVRAHLNYGHTFGHALEADTGYGRYLHGEAVGIGMRMAAELAKRIGLLEDDDLILRQDLLLAAYDLPTTHADPDPAAAAERLAGLCSLDKKVRAGRTRFVLPRRLGEVAIVEDPDPAAVVAAFRSAIVAG